MPENDWTAAVVLGEQNLNERDREEADAHAMLHGGVLSMFAGKGTCHGIRTDH
ncbi:MAG: hypothetical protein H0U76_28000 [Ktedonobacteraceae bacterium]|nr:hypothetical protein [Ktedonobacteraceae bacterium]